MTRLPKVLATSVVRSAHEGESHGGIYLIDLGRNQCDQVVRWDYGAINWEGRGSERGLRGIAFSEDLVIIAASDELLLYDQQLNIVDRFRNPYLKHCHEIFIEANVVWLTSTAFDCVLGFDLEKGGFSTGYHLERGYRNRLARKAQSFPTYSVRQFDPEEDDGPRMRDRLHVNNVWRHDGSLLMSGTELRHIVAVRDGSSSVFSRVPIGTHNAQPFLGGVIANHTAKNQIVYMNKNGRPMRSFPIMTYDEANLLNSSLPADHARQAFGRGLCVWQKQLVIGGSSPATISVFDFDTQERVESFNITMDVRNAIHGLEVWPF
jgi:hypothetical protein